MTTSDIVKLVSNDGFEFIVSRSTACVSQTIKNMLDVTKGFAESVSNTVTFENISGETLEVVVQYLCYNEKYQGVDDVPELDLPLECVLEVLLAADYLDL